MLAFLKAKPEKRKELESILKSLAPTRSELDNIAYVMHRSTKNPDDMMFNEI
jgi:quinol monooxygenase YgiN